MYIEDGSGYYLGIGVSLVYRGDNAHVVLSVDGSSAVAVATPLLVV